MYRILLIPIIFFNFNLFAQPIQMLETENSFSTLELVCINVSDSLKIKHSVSGSAVKYESDSSDYHQNYKIKITEGEIHSIWITNNEIHKGIFFSGGKLNFDFKLEVDLNDPDIIRLYWVEEFQQYYIEKMNYDELMAGFEK